MWVAKARRLASLGLLSISLAALAWSLWPVPQRTLRVDLPPGGGALALRLPGFVRVGEPAEILLELSAPSGAPHTAGSAILTARLELPGLEHAPTGEMSQAQPASRPAAFRWEIRSAHPGVFDGVIWLYTAAPVAGQPQPARQVLSAQRFQIRSADFLGLDSRWAMALGIAGAVVGAVFGLDAVVIWFLRRFIIQ